jgi:hypothetical protein
MSLTSTWTGLKIVFLKVLTCHQLCNGHGIFDHLVHTSPKVLPHETLSNYAGQYAIILLSELDIFVFVFPVSRSILIIKYRD